MRRPLAVTPSASSADGSEPLIQTAQGPRARSVGAESEAEQLPPKLLRRRRRGKLPKLGAAPPSECRDGGLSGSEGGRGTGGERTAPTLPPLPWRTTARSAALAQRWSAEGSEVAIDVESGCAKSLGTGPPRRSAERSKGPPAAGPPVLLGRSRTADEGRRPLCAPLLALLPALLSRGVPPESRPRQDPATTSVVEVGSAAAMLKTQHTAESPHPGPSAPSDGAPLRTGPSALDDGAPSRSGLSGRVPLGRRGAAACSCGGEESVTRTFTIDFSVNAAVFRALFGASR
mmetsp:Transcript_56713/g.122080  ORF Transcript_56713/g.122080 Transcript_56713/m.122080 type:complete len:288 (+) Transcript_56713:99-962(+)